MCVPNPALDPKDTGDPKPSSILLRVKTGDDADELLENINKHKGEWRKWLLDICRTDAMKPGFYSLLPMCINILAVNKAYDHLFGVLRILFPPKPLIL